jgi:putative DNA methylase
MNKKLIEVALPLEAINVASAREKSIRHGHPSTLHLWWARRPLAACRAVLFASLVDDPSSRTDLFPTEAEQDAERQRLFGIIERLVQWENSNNPEVLAEARAEILKSTDGNPPPILDPFCGGGSIPLEAQRLGLEAHGSDLNPVAVLITKALIEIPPKFAGQSPINPEARKGLAHSGAWSGATGLADDVRYYGKWMREEAEKRIGHLYPKAKLPDEMGGGEATVIAWIWARTVKCPNPACGCQMPLVRSFALSTKVCKQAWVEPAVDRTLNTISYTIKTGAGTPREGTVGRKGAVCLCCNTPVPLDHIRIEGKAKRIRVQLMALVAEWQRGRIYLPPNSEQEEIAASAIPEWTPESELPKNPRDFKTPNYGMNTHADLFTNRQLVALSTFSELVGEARSRVRADAFHTLQGNEPGSGASLLDAYTDAVATYLGLAVSRLSDACNALCSWSPGGTQSTHLFTRQAIPMRWDFSEANVFAGAAGDFGVSLHNLCKALLSTPALGRGRVQNIDATELSQEKSSPVVSTDPPYYDNIGYADLSDFFYVWLRRALGSVYPALFGTILVPKAQELVATPYRFGGSRDKASAFFEEGLGCVFAGICRFVNTTYPMTVYYAFKQSETEDDGDEDTGDTSAVTASTGWETFLQGLIDAGFQVTATWPMRTERTARSLAIGTNALASSIVLACRPRLPDALTSTRREFVNALRRELEDALLKMMHGNVAPVDLAQATIGPGMAVYSRYSKVIETDGKPLRVRAALQIINQELDTILAATEGEYDGDTRFCLAWFEQFGLNSGAFGEADVLARAKDTAVQALADTGLLEAKAGKVRLLKRDEYPIDWTPKAGDRTPVWECTQQLVRALFDQGSEGTAARIVAALGSKAEPARDLAYRLYSLCERKGWAQEALAYNSLVIAWPEITKLASNPNIALPDANLFTGEG